MQLTSSIVNGVKSRCDENIGNMFNIFINFIIFTAVNIVIIDKIVTAVG